MNMDRIKNVSEYNPDHLEEQELNKNAKTNKIKMKVDSNQKKEPL